MESAESTPRPDEDLVRAALGPEPTAYGELFHRWYDRCFDIAWNISRNRETAADVAQDAFLSCWQHLADLREPAAFGGWVLRATRNQALNRLERDRTRAYEPLMSGEAIVAPDADADPARVTERHDRQRLVWTAAAALGERDTSLLDLHLRHGLEPSEIADELQITPNNAHQLLFRLRSRLRQTIVAALLWREGRPTCPSLATIVPTNGRFDAQVASAIRKHQRGCDDCASEAGRESNPEWLFAGVPFAIAPLALKARAVAALIQAGVPISPIGSAALSAGAAGAGHAAGASAGHAAGASAGHAAGASAGHAAGAGAGHAAARLFPPLRGLGRVQQWTVIGAAAGVLLLGSALVITHQPPSSGGRPGGGIAAGSSVGTDPGTPTPTDSPATPGTPGTTAGGDATDAAGGTPQGAGGTGGATGTTAGGSSGKGAGKGAATTAKHTSHRTSASRASTTSAPARRTSPTRTSGPTEPSGGPGDPPTAPANTPPVVPMPPGPPCVCGPWHWHHHYGESVVWCAVSDHCKLPDEVRDCFAVIAIEPGDVRVVACFTGRP